MSKAETHWISCFLMTKTWKKPVCDSFNEKISKTALECVDMVAPLTTANLLHKSKDWITNETKNAIMKIYKLSHLWMQSPSEINKDLTKRQKNVATMVVKNARRAGNYPELGNESPSETIYRTLEYQFAKDEPIHGIPNIEKLSMNTSHLCGKFYQPKTQNMIIRWTYQILKKQWYSIIWQKWCRTKNKRTKEQKQELVMTD